MTWKHRHQEYNWDGNDTQRNKAHLLLITVVYFSSGWWCLPIWPAGGAVVKRMETEMHINRAEKHKEGHAERRSGIPVPPLFLFSSSRLCAERRGRRHVRERTGLYMFRESVSTLRLMRRRNNVVRLTVRWWRIRSLCAFGWAKKETGGWGKTRGGGPIVQAPRYRERENTCQVWCGCAAQCIVGHVEVQWCCHGDTLRQSVLVVGVTECKSAYATSALIFTARATRKHLTRSRCLRATPAFQRQRGAGMQRRPILRSRERFKDLKQRGKRREGFSSASAVRGVRQGVGGMDGWGGRG